MRLERRTTDNYSFATALPYYLIILVYTPTNRMTDKRVSAGLASLIRNVELNTAGWQGKACRQLILATLWYSSEPLANQAIRAELANSCSVALLPARLAEELRTLSGERAVVQTPSGKWKLAEQERRRCDGEVKEAEASSDKAFGRFSLLLRDSGVDLDHQHIWSRFNENFLLPLVSAIGAQTYELMAGESGDLEWIGILNGFASEFPRELQAKLKAAVGRFLNPNDSEVRDYVLRYLNAFFYLEALRLSESALNSITQTTEPRFKVFLDTNFVFSMLDLHDNPANEAAESLKVLLQHLDQDVTAEMFVLPTTLDEAKRVLANARSQLTELRLPPNLAQAGKDAGVSGIALRFIERVAKQGGHLSASTYFAPYLSDLIGCLRREGVEIYNERMHGYATRQDITDDILSELEYEETHHASTAKGYKQVEHDVILWHFVRDKRPAALETPVNADFWVVTIDYRLLSFDRRKRTADIASVPVCLHPTNFVQMLQFWFSRTEELDRALIGSIQLPFLFHDFDHEAEQVTLKILSVLARYAGVDALPEDTATAVMLNRALRERIAGAKGPEEELSLVHDALIEENARVAAQLREMELHLGRLENRVSSELSEKAEYKDVSMQQHEELAKLQTRAQQLEKDRDDLQQLLEEYEAKHAESKALTRLVWLWCVLPLVAVLGASCLSGYLFARFLGAPLYLTALSTFLIGTALVGCLPRKAMIRLNISSDTPVTRSVRLLAKTSAIVALGAAGSILGALIVVQILHA